MENSLKTMEINTLTTEILILKQQTAQNLIEIGKRLLAAKEILQHGEWGKWIQEKVDFSERTAQNLMKVAKEFSNPQSIADLPPTKIFALLDLPQEERESFKKDNDIENMSTRELKQAIKEKNEALKQLTEKSVEAERLLEANKAMEAFAKLTEQSLSNTQEDVKTLQEALKKEQKNSKEQVAKLESSIADLKNQLSGAQASGNDDEIKRISESLIKADNELADALEVIKDLERQLKEKPIEVSAVTTVEKIPDEIQQEIDELRKKANQQGNPAALKFKVYFESLVGNFKSLLEVLAEIPEDETERYKSAIVGLIGKMSERL